MTPIPFATSEAGPLRCLRNLNPPGVLQGRTLCPFALLRLINCLGGYFRGGLHSEGRRPGDVAFTAGRETSATPATYPQASRHPLPTTAARRSPQDALSRCFALSAGFEHRVSTVLSMGSNR